MTKTSINHGPALLALLLAAATAGILGCGSASVCQGQGCKGTSSGSGNFTPGPFPHTATSLDGPMCYTDGPVIRLFQDSLFTDPAVPTTVTRADSLRVYWTICNHGMDPSTSQSEAYTLSRTLRGETPTTVDVATYALPALDSCHCDVQSRVFQNELDPGSYTFALTGAVAGSVDRNINP
jgi:hypothetical protein